MCKLFVEKQQEDDQDDMISELSSELAGSEPVQSSVVAVDSTDPASVAETDLDVAKCKQKRRFTKWGPKTKDVDYRNLPLTLWSDPGIPFSKDVDYRDTSSKLQTDPVVVGDKDVDYRENPSTSQSQQGQTEVKSLKTCKLYKSQAVDGDLA